MQYQTRATDIFEFFHSKQNIPLNRNILEKNQFKGIKDFS